MDKIKTVAMVMLLEGNCNLYMLLFENNALNQKTIHSSMAYYVHMLIYKAKKNRLLSCYRFAASQLS
jgi:hypothetical protein